VSITFQRRSIVLGILLVAILLMVALAGVAYRTSVEHPPNLLWALFSGYYRYDPRHQTPPDGLFLDRPEVSLAYFFDSTLKLCSGKYPPLSSQPVKRYEVEEVEYLGHTDYHAFSLLHTRIYFAGETSVRAVFRFEAYHNEAYPLLLMDTATIRTAGWMVVGGLLRDPHVLPPGFRQLDEVKQPYTCDPSPPYKVEEIQ
jgi:hypothetical protein